MGINIKGTGGRLYTPGTGSGRLVSKINTPTIETSGLVLHLDAGNAASYPGSGATWYDISGNSKDATLYNTPTYSAANGGTITFSPASSQYAQGPALTSCPNFSAGVWAKMNALPASGYPALFTDLYGGTPVNYINFCILFFNQSNKLQGGYYEEQYAGWRLANNPSPIYEPTVGDWHNYVATYDGSTVRFYIDGSEYSTLTTADPVAGSGLGYRIAANWGGNPPTVFADATIPHVTLYDRALSAGEVLGNFNVIKSRYGL